MRQLQGGAGVSLRERVFTIVQSCLESRDLGASRNVYSLIIKAGLDSVCVLGDHLIRLFAACSSLPEANYIFTHIQPPSLFTWNSILSAHIQLGHPQGALSLYFSMRILPDQVTLSNVLKASINTQDIHAGRQAHTQIVLHGIPLDYVVGGTLIDFYAKLGTLEEASRVFHALPSRDVVSWGAMIAGFLQHGQFESYLSYLGRMQQEGIQPNKVVFLLGLKACSNRGDLAHGLPIHAEVCKFGLDKDPTLQSSLIEVYSKCGLLEEAESVFKKADCRDLVLWSSMLGAHVHSSRHELAFKVYEQMLVNGVSPDKVVFLFLLQACGDTGNITEGFQVHKEITMRALDNDMAVENTLISMYAKCGDLNQANGIFHHMQFRDEVSWTVIITGYINHGQYLQGVELFANMQLEGFYPNSSVISCILIACGNLSAFDEGRLIHDCVIRLDFQDLYISNALVYMYSRLSNLRDTQYIFDSMPERDMASWSSTIFGYAEHGQVQDVLNLLERMHLEGLQPDEVILMCSLSACGTVGALQESNRIFHVVLNYGMELDTRLACEIVCMYVSCGTLQDAQAAYDRVAKPDVVLGSALIDGYCESGQVSCAIRCVEEMLKGGAEPDAIAYLSLLQLCCELGSIDEGRLLHSQIVEFGFDCISSIHSSVLDMYIKCGSIEDAHLLFTNKVEERDLVLWSSMLSGFALTGNNKMVNQCLKDIERECLESMSAILAGIWRACSHTGLLEDGRQFFHHMNDSIKVVPSSEHYICIVDLLSRVGHVNDAKDVLQTTPSRVILGCTSLLESYHTYGNQGCCLDQQ